MQKKSSQTFIHAEITSARAMITIFGTHDDFQALWSWVDFGSKWVKEWKEKSCSFYGL